MNEASAVIVQTAIRKGEKKLIFENDSDGLANWNPGFGVFDSVIW